MSRSDWESGCCSCHLHPPCGWCTSSAYFECKSCKKEFLDYCPDYDDPDYEEPLYCVACEGMFTNIVEFKYFDDSLGTRLSRALDYLNNQNLKDAVMDEYCKQQSPKDLEKFVRDLLSPDLATIVIKNLK